jgi:hypothetical protein
MRISAADCFAAMMLLLPLVSFAQNYKAEQATDHGVDIVRLTDAAHGVEVTVVAELTCHELRNSRTSIGPHWSIMT